MCSFVCHVAKHNYHTLLFPVGRSLPVPCKQLSPIRWKQLSIMPRSLEQMLNVQRVREKIKKKSVKYSHNAQVSLQVGVMLNGNRLSPVNVLTNLSLADFGHRSVRYTEMRLSDGGSHAIHLQLRRRDTEASTRAQVQAYQAGTCVCNIGDLE